MKNFFSVLLLLLILLIPKANGSIIGDLTQVFNIQRGATINHSFILHNIHNVPITYNLTQSDYIYSAEGNVDFLHPNSLPGSNAGWIQLSNHSIILQPNEKREIPYLIKVPQDIAPGAYWSIILIEPNDTTQQPTNWLQVKVRYAYQVITQLGQAAPSILISELTKRFINDQQYLTVDVENKGEYFFQTTPTIKLYDPEGHLVINKTLNNEKLLPGSSVRLYIPIDQEIKDESRGFLIFNENNKVIKIEKLIYDSSD